MDSRSNNVLKHAGAATASSDVFMGNGATGESLFVINLCAANMPQAIDAHSVQEWGIAGIERYRLYQVSRMEDGRRRYRVRLGFFTSEADAETVLQTVRGKFASAFSSCLGDEDIKHASGYLKKPLTEIQEIQDLQRTGRYRIPKIAAQDLPPEIAAPKQTQAVRPAVAPPLAPALKSPPSTATTRAANPPAAKPKPAAASVDEMVEFEWTPDANIGARTRVRTSAPSAPIVAAKPAQPASAPIAKAPTAPIAPAAAKSAPPTLKQAPKAEAKPQKTIPTSVAKPAARTEKQGFQVAAGRSIPDHGLSLAPETQVAKPKPASAPIAAASSPAKPVSDLPRPLVSAEALAKLRAAAHQPRNQGSVIPTLDTTQTIRTLTKTEIEDANAEKWFVVQLAISDHPANLDTMPRLDIFEAYRLYSVAIMEGTLIRHALRLGFFKEQVSAEAVLGYLKTFFGDPHIERISDAEQRRFAEPPALKTNAPEPLKPQSRVITLEEKRGKQSAADSVQPAVIGAAGKNGAAAKIAPKYATSNVKRSPPLAQAKKGQSYKPTSKKVISQSELDEARLLGLSDTAIRRVEHNPSLLSRLVGKLTK